MKVVFALRSDAIGKPGGDSKKVERYREGLVNRGWDVQVVHSPEELHRTKMDILHLLNLDLPLENSNYLRIGKKVAKRTVLSTIRHPIEGMNQMFGSGQDVYYRRLKSMGLTADSSFILRERLKLLRNGHRAGLEPGLSFRAKQTELAKNVDLMLPMAAGEKVRLQSDFEPTREPLVVPNGFSFRGMDNDANGEKTYDLVTVGRIEPRKNTLALAKAADSLGLSLLVVGSANLKHKSYVQDFLALSKKSKFVHYVGPRDKNGVLQALRSAKTYVNSAWFEVVSQADAEAAALGLSVITTKHSYASDFIRGATLDFDPGKLVGERGAQYLREMLERSTSAIVHTDTSWDDSVQCLVTAYESVFDD